MINVILELVVVISLILSLCLIYWQLNAKLYRTINQEQQWLITPIIAPGVICHELSHLVLAIISFRRIIDVKLYSFSHQNGELGHVNYGHRGNGVLTKIIDLFISMAPIYGALLAMCLASYFLLPETAYNFFYHNYKTLITSSPTNVDYWHTCLDLSLGFIEVLKFDLESLIWLGLIVSLSHGAIPSSVDIKNSLPGIIIVIVLCIIILILDPFGVSVFVYGVISYLKLLFTLIVFLGVPLVVANTVATSILVIKSFAAWLIKILMRSKTRAF